MKKNIDCFSKSLPFIFTVLFLVSCHSINTSKIDTRIKIEQVNNKKLMTAYPVMIKSYPKSFYFLQKVDDIIYLYISYGNNGVFTINELKDTTGRSYPIEILKKSRLNDLFYLFGRIPLSLDQLEELSFSNISFYYKDNNLNIGFLLSYTYSRNFYETIMKENIKEAVNDKQYPSN